MNSPLENPAPSRALVVMAKAPEPGATKTRLVPALTHGQAAELYECFLRDTLDLVRSLPDVSPLVAVWPADAAEYFQQVAPDFEQVEQRGESLAERLDHVLTTCLAAGFSSVVAINSDSPTLPRSRVTAAFERLDLPGVDIVLGPADDGGYYLIGWRRPHSHLVLDVTMSTPQVLDDTLRLAAESDLSVALLDPWYDVDEAADLVRLCEDLQAGSRFGRHTSAFLEANLELDFEANLEVVFEANLEVVFEANLEVVFEGPTRTAMTASGSRLPDDCVVAVIIPALDEALNIAGVVEAVRNEGIDSVIVVDNGSTDDTASVALAAGAKVVSEPRAGYGYACAAGSQAALAAGADVLVYIDGDHSSRADEMATLVEPIRDGDADLVLGSRVLGSTDKGSMKLHQRLGNRLAAALMRRLYGVKVTDLGPYRAIRSDVFVTVGMSEMTFGWPTEMTVKCARAKARIVEVPVAWHIRNAGRSKVSGTIRGSILAGYHILAVTIRHSRSKKPEPS